MKQFDRKSHLLLVEGQRSAGQFAVLAFVGALIMAAFLVLPVGTWAKGVDARKQPGPSADFTVAGTNGYSLDVKQ